jgi:3-oxoacyl-[acyl-carrier protein] reductase
MDELKGKIAIVTGAASGIGSSVAELFAEEKVSGLALADVQPGAMHRLAADLRKRFGSDVLVSETDVSDPAKVDQMAQASAERYGRIDILVNNAGICPMVPWDQTTLENWNQMLSVNLTGAFLCSKAVLPHMRKQRFGRLVHISSVGGFVGSITGHVGYGVSKAGIIALSKYLAKQFASEGILSNAIAPGSINTPLSDRFGEENKQRYVELSLVKRQGTPREVAEAVLFLAGPRSGYVTGSTMHVNGGSLLI